MHSSPEKTRALLERTCASASLSGSPQLVRFLRYVVDQTLDGNSQALKEYTIGVAALGRPSSFDPSANAVVRVEARRLRTKLAEYFDGDGLDEPVVIELPKGSYVPQFVERAPARIPISAIQHEPIIDRTVGATPTSSVDPISPVASKRASALSSRRTIGAIGIAAATVLGIVGPAILGRVGRASETDADTTPAFAIAATNQTADTSMSVVVLPFLNLTGTPDQEFVSDGLTEDLTARLAREPGFKVIARTSAFSFKGKPQDVREIGAKLGVASVVEGSVQRMGNKLHVTAQLNRARDGVHRWAATYDVPASNMFVLQDSIARAVVQVMHSTAIATRRATVFGRTTKNGEAYTAYLQGRYYWNRRDVESMQRAIKLYERAISLDPQFAQAWAGLASTHAVMAVNSQVPSSIAQPKAIDAARRALAIDSTLGEPHATIGLLKGFVDWNWTAADVEFVHAIALSPNSASAHSWYANTLMARGNLEAALSYLQQAHEIDPLSLPIMYSIGETYFYARRFEDAIKQTRDMLTLDSTYTGAYALRAKSQLYIKQFDDARKTYLRMGDTLLVGWFAFTGRQNEARERMKYIDTTLRTVAPFSVACMYAQTGLVDTAFMWLDKAYAMKAPDIVSLKVEPSMDALRADPRYRVLLQKIGL